MRKILSKAHIQQPTTEHTEYLTSLSTTPQQVPREQTLRSPRQSSHTNRSSAGSQIWFQIIIFHLISLWMHASALRLPAFKLRDYEVRIPPTSKAFMMLNIGQTFSKALVIIIKKAVKCVFCDWAWNTWYKVDRSQSCALLIPKHWGQTCVIHLALVRWAVIVTYTFVCSDLYPIRWYIA